MLLLLLLLLDDKSFAFPSKRITNYSSRWVCPIDGVIIIIIIIIFSDVKPSNILVSIDGAFKLCDFGISGKLVDSIAKTMDVGCRPYMAPERIDPCKASLGYTILSDVWSYGITLVRLTTPTDYYYYY